MLLQYMQKKLLEARTSAARRWGKGLHQQLHLLLILTSYKIAGGGMAHGMHLDSNAPLLQQKNKLH